MAASASTSGCEQYSGPSGDSTSNAGNTPQRSVARWTSCRRGVVDDHGTVPVDLLEAEAPDVLNTTVDDSLRQDRRFLELLVAPSHSTSSNTGAARDSDEGTRISTIWRAQSAEFPVCVMTRPNRGPIDDKRLGVFRKLQCLRRTVQVARQLCGRRSRRKSLTDFCFEDRFEGFSVGFAADDVSRAEQPAPVVEQAREPAMTISPA